MIWLEALDFAPTLKRRLFQAAIWVIAVVSIADAVTGQQLAAALFTALMAAGLDRVQPVLDAAFDGILTQPTVTIKEQRHAIGAAIGALARP